MLATWLISKLCLIEEIELTTNSKNSMQVLYATSDYSYAYMQPNLKDIYNFQWKFVYLCKYLILCYV